MGRRVIFKQVFLGFYGIVSEIPQQEDGIALICPLISIELQKCLV